MSGRRPQVFKNMTRAASGGAAVVLALLALLFLRGPGTGSNSDDASLSAPKETMASTEPPAQPSEDADTTPDTKPDDQDTESIAGGLSPDEEKALATNVLGILIDDWDYLLEVPGESQSIYRPEDLKRLIELAKLTEGDSNGIRVRILQRESARPKAEQQLRAALGEIGIGAEAVYMPGDFIP